MNLTMIVSKSTIIFLYKMEDKIRKKNKLSIVKDKLALIVGRRR